MTITERSTPASLADTDVIAASELRQLILEDPAIRVLDVRSGGEFEGVHIPGSYNIGRDTLAEHTQELASLDHPVVLVCQSGSRAGQAHHQLTEAGKQRLHVLDGGIEAWVGAGGDVIRSGRQTWAMDRQVRLVAGSISLLGIVGSLVVPKAKWLSGAVAAGLTFSAVSNTCAMATVLGKLPYNRGQESDIDGVLAAMQASA